MRIFLLRNNCYYWSLKTFSILTWYQSIINYCDTSAPFSCSLLWVSKMLLFACSFLDFPCQICIGCSVLGYPITSFFFSSPNQLRDLRAEIEEIILNIFFCSFRFVVAFFSQAVVVFTAHALHCSIVSCYKMV